MGNPITLADLKIGREAITVELIELDDQEALRITWPKKSLAISANRFPDLAASITRAFLSASIELARSKGPWL
jgi:hypothetical protein